MSLTPASARFLRLIRATRLLVCALAASWLFGCSENQSEGESKTSPTANNAMTGTNQYELGKALRFAAGGNSEPYKVSGWSAAETGHTWSEKKSAVLAFKVQPTERPLTLRATMTGLTKQPELPDQTVEVLANGTKIANWQVNETEKQFSADIPAATITSDGSLQIQFNIPKATSPTALGLGKDDRILGISVSALQID